MANARFANLRGDVEDPIEKEQAIKDKAAKVVSSAETKSAPAEVPTRLPTEAEGAAFRQKEAKEQLAEIAVRMSEKQTGYDKQIADLEAEGDASFFDKLGSEGGVATGIAALIATATGHGDLGAGLLMGGLQGASQAVQLSDKRKDAKLELLTDASFNAGKEAMAALLGEAALDNEQELQKNEIASRMEMMFAGFEDSTSKMYLQDIFNTAARESDQSFRAGESDLERKNRLEMQSYDHVFRGKEADLERIHREIMQDDSQDWETKERELKREAEETLQLNELDTRRFLEAARLDHEERKYLFGAEHEMTMAEVNKNVSKELMKYQYDEDEKVAVGKYWRDLALKDPELAFALADAQGMDTSSMWGVERANILAKKSKDFRIDADESRILNAMFAEAVENGDHLSASSIMTTMGYDNVTSDLLKGMVDGKNLEQQREYFFTNLPGMMRNMTVGSQLEVSKYLADPVNAGDFLGALQKGVPVYDPIAKEAADAVRRQENTAAIFKAYYEMDGADRQAAQQSLTEYVNDTLKEDEAAFMGESGGIDYILANLGSDSYTMSNVARKGIEAEFAASDPEGWAKLDKDDRDTKVIRTFLERKESERRGAVANNIKTTVAYVDHSMARIEHESGVNVNSALWSQFVYRAMQGPNAPTTEAEANAMVDKMANKAIELGSDKYMSPVDRAANFLNSMFAFGWTYKDTRGEDMAANPLFYMFGRQVDAVELLEKLEQEKGK